MRIAFISNPNSIHTRRWVNWFAQHGHQVLIFADEPLKYSWSETEIIELPQFAWLRKLRYWAWGLWMKRYLAHWKADILHAHRVNSAGWAGVFVGHPRFVVTPWGSDLYIQARKSLVARALAKIVLQRAELVTADSKDLLDLAIKLGAHSDKAHLIQWGVDLDLFMPGSAEPLRAALGIPAGPVILSPRAAAPLYNLDNIVKAFAVAHKTIPQASLLLRDYNSEAGYREKIQTEIDRLGISESVFWLEHMEPWERNVDTYRLASLAISIPSSDGTPISVLEAMACKVPVIASDLPSLREWIRHEENGLLVNHQDVQTLANLIQEILNDPAKQAIFGNQGREMVQQQANHQSEMKKVEYLYQQLIERIDPKR